MQPWRWTSSILDLHWCLKELLLKFKLKQQWSSLSQIHKERCICSKRYPLFQNSWIQFTYLPSFISFIWTLHLTHLADPPFTFFLEGTQKSRVLLQKSTRTWWTDALKRSVNQGIQFWVLQRCLFKECSTWNRSFDFQRLFTHQCLLDLNT